jgi:hypothetical protein
MFETPYDPDEITLEIETEEGTDTITIPLDFSDLNKVEIERVAILTQGAADLAEVACASLFVAACRQIDLTDEAFPSFARHLAPLWSEDPSIVKLV